MGTIADLAKERADIAGTCSDLDASSAREGNTAMRPLPRVERQTLSVPDACKVLGISRPVGYALIKRGEFPVPVIRLGRRIVIGRQALENLLSGVATPDQDAA